MNDSNFLKVNPDAPKMADPPPAHFRLFKSPFWSTGRDCFGPLTVKTSGALRKGVASSLQALHAAFIWSYWTA